MLLCKDSTYVSNFAVPTALARVITTDKLTIWTRQTGTPLDVVKCRIHSPCGYKSNKQIQT